jgi:hypothetical protein
MKTGSRFFRYPIPHLSGFRFLRRSIRDVFPFIHPKFRFKGISQMSINPLTIKGQLFETRTYHDLVMLIVRLRYERGLNEKARRLISAGGQKYGLLDSDGRPTSKYFAFMNDEVEKLARRELTGHTKQAAGLCACGCGRMVRGKAKSATQACRKRMSRQVGELAA